MLDRHYRSCWHALQQYIARTHDHLWLRHERGSEKYSLRGYDADWKAYTLIYGNQWEVIGMLEQLAYRYEVRLSISGTHSLYTELLTDFNIDKISEIYNSVEASSC